MAKTSNTLGSQGLLQIAVNQHHELLKSAIEKSGAIDAVENIEWVSPLQREGNKEYRDKKALEKLRVHSKLTAPLSEFWPARGLVWDALGVTSTGTSILVEAKAHIPEAASLKSQATHTSLEHIRRSLDAARAVYAPRSSADWSGHFYQYANRLAFQLFLRKTNNLPSKLVFLYFTNAVDMNGPESELEWHGAIRLIHTVLGLPADLKRFGVFHAFIDARQLTEATVSGVSSR